MTDQNCRQWNTCDERGEWCQRVPEGHNEHVCHNISLKRRNIICEMKKLVDQSFNSPLCQEWDTECSLNNTKGPRRFGRIERGKQHQELIYSQLVSRCDCDKRNGLQDDCRRWNCRGSPDCKTTPFPKCRPSRGEPSDKTVPAYNSNKECYMPTFFGPEICDNCNTPTVDKF